jgi:hypothetical protein
VDLPQKRQTPSDRRREARRLAERIQKAGNPWTRRELYADKARARVAILIDAENSERIYGRSRVEGGGGSLLRSPRYR